jgi:hypothetical protein
MMWLLWVRFLLLGAMFALAAVLVWAVAADRG